MWHGNWFEKCYTSTSALLNDDEQEEEGRKPVNTHAYLFTVELRQLVQLIRLIAQIVQQNHEHLLGFRYTHTHTHRFEQNKIFQGIMFEH